MRLRRGLAAVLITSGVVLTTAGAGRTVGARATPLPLPHVSSQELVEQYAAIRHTIDRAAQDAGRTGDRGRATRLAALGRPDRQFLAFDPGGGGRAIEVVGDLAHAARVAVLVPGADTDLMTFDARGDKPYATPGGGARSLYGEARRLQPDARLAVIAWLGYRPPQTISLDVATDEHAGAGAPGLRNLVAAVRGGGARVSLLCHSYGSVVCARAAKDLPVTDIAVYGSPGMGISSAAALGTPARVWAARGASDWMQFVPHVKLLGLGFGADPVGHDFGARVFAAGAGGHSDYLKPGSSSVRNLALIALGRVGEVRS